MGNQMNRREFLALMGITGAGAASLSCTGPMPEENWKPWVEPIEGDIPYVPRYYATTTHHSNGYGLKITTVDGRIISAMGNPLHPVNGNSLPAREQAVIQNLYGLERISKPQMKGGQEITWRQALGKVKEQLDQARGNGVFALTNPLTGANAELWKAFVAQSGNGKHVSYGAFSQADLLVATEKVFGKAVVPLFSLAGADMVLSLGAQFLETWGDAAANARNYSEIRSVKEGTRATHIQVEARISGTGSNADLRLQAKPGSETHIALALLGKVAEESSNLSDSEKEAIRALVGDHNLESASKAAGVALHGLEEVAHHLTAAKAGLVLPAESLSLGNNAVAHQVAVHLLNKALGAIGSRVNLDAGKPADRVSSHQEIADLVSSLNAGNVKMLFIKGTNPVFSLPAAVNFKDAMAKTFTVAFADQMNETVANADLILPVTHDLESWGDVSTYLGVDMLMQPAMRPRWDVKQAEDHLIDWMLAFNADAVAETSFADYLKNKWKARLGVDEIGWRQALREGGRFTLQLSGSDYPISGSLSGDLFGKLQGPADGTALVIHESLRFGDGSYASSPWLQELPDAMTGVTWDAFAEISYEKAGKLGLKWGDFVRLEANGNSVELQVALSETIADEAVYFATGYGHTALHKLYNRGANAFNFLNSELNEAGVFASAPLAVNIQKAGRHAKLATFHVPGMGDKLNTPQTKLFAESKRSDTDPHHEREIWQSVSLATLVSEHGGHSAHGHGGPINMKSNFPISTMTKYNPLFKGENEPNEEGVSLDEPNFYPDRSKTLVVEGRKETFYQEYKWEMAIDLNKCNGCSACVTACYAENNIPIVGKDQVAKGREMAWLRINRYLGYAEKDGKTAIQVAFMPMMCQQCASAPCETVCPSLATYHNKEGLNAMVYNRCVGTRYCANNCSYKVRRFNWYTWKFEGDFNWQLNPTVSVRHAGVMEKCTFCVQRLREAKDHARDEGRKVHDGEAKTACQEACPAQAIEFGNFSDEESRVHKLSKDVRAYRALNEHLRTRPGVSYLKRVVLAEENHA